MMINCESQIITTDLSISIFIFSIIIQINAIKGITTIDYIMYILAHKFLEIEIDAR